MTTDDIDKYGISAIVSRFSKSQGYRVEKSNDGPESHVAFLHDVLCGFIIIKKVEGKYNKDKILSVPFEQYIKGSERAFRENVFLVYIFFFPTRLDFIFIPPSGPQHGIQVKEREVLIPVDLLVNISG